PDEARRRSPKTVGGRTYVRRMGVTIDSGAAIGAAIGTPMLAVGGALAGQLLQRRAARELDVRWHREETMRLLRWAAELAVDGADERSAIGIAALHALSRSELVQRADQIILGAVLDAVVDPVAAGYDGTGS